MRQADADGRTERASPAGDAPPTTGLVPAALAPLDHELRFGEMTSEANPEELQARSIEANAMLLRSILEAMPDALVVIDISGEILLFSKAAETMFGFSASEVVGQNVSLLMPEMVREQHDVHMARYRSTGQSGMIGRSRRLIGRRKDGSEFPHSPNYRGVRRGKAHDCGLYAGP